TDSGQQCLCQSVRATLPRSDIKDVQIYAQTAFCNKQCLCQSVRATIPRSDIKDIQIYAQTAFCNKVEIVVTTASRRFCLDPQNAKVKKLMDKILRKTAYGQANRIQLSSHLNFSAQRLTSDPSAKAPSNLDHFRRLRCRLHSPALCGRHSSSLFTLCMAKTLESGTSSGIFGALSSPIGMTRRNTSYDEHMDAPMHSPPPDLTVNILWKDPVIPQHKFRNTAEQTQENLQKFEHQAGLTDAGYSPHKGLSTEETRFHRLGEGTLPAAASISGVARQRP
ncbi:hypothetical protein INR49_024360, partial [Caranx melampygus]